MHRRLMSISGAVAFALLIPFSSVSADTLFPPTGSYLSLVSETLCSDGLCTYVQLNASDTTEGLGVCVIINHITEEFGTTYEIESGCSTVPGLGDPIYTNGFFTGVTDTTIIVRSDLTDQDREVVVSSENVATTKVKRETERDSLVTEDCRFDWMSRNVSVSIAGTVTLSGTVFGDEGGSLNRATKLRQRC